MIAPTEVQAPPMVTFRAIVLKELREGVRSFVAMFAVVGLGLWFSMLGQRFMTANGAATPDITTLTLFTITSALAALFIGGAQSLREARGDKWGFLTHRPVTRRTLFFGKTVAGLLLYLIAAGVPLALATAWNATPGHRAMPYDGRMALPGIADLLTGIVYYFTAMLIGMREARWYATRFLPLGAALLCSTYVLAAESFAGAVAGIAVIAAVIGTAALGTFVAGGRYEPLPAVSRAAAGISIGAGIVVASTIAIGIAGFLVAIRRPDVRESRSTGYAIASDGAVVQTITVQHLYPPAKEIVQVNDLAGRPLAQYKDSVARARISAGVISTADLPLNVSGHYLDIIRHPGYRGTDDIFVPLASPVMGSSATSWYFVRRAGAIAVYQNQSARLAGWVGPDGFLAGGALPARRFEGELRPYTELWYAQPLLAFPKAVYRIDRAHQRVAKIFSAPEDEDVLGAVSSGDTAAMMTPYGTRVPSNVYETPTGEAEVFSTTTQTTEVFATALVETGDSAPAASAHDPRAWFDVIGTTKNVYVQSENGTPELTVPRDSHTENYGDVIVARPLKVKGSPTFFWYHPASGIWTPGDQLKHTGLITEIGGDKRVLAQIAVPVPPAYPQVKGDWSDLVGAAVLQPLGFRVAVSIYRQLEPNSIVGKAWPRTSQLASNATAVAAALLFAAAAFFLGAMYAFERRRRMLWTGIAFVLGPLGVLLMLSLSDWPARERCPSCARRRVVTRVRCEHCDAPFAAPPFDGTEIFETMPA